MQYIVINRCYGGFSLSDDACKRLVVKYIDHGEAARNGYYMERDNPELVKIIQELGPAANGAHAKLSIVEVPDGVEWTIEEYNGTEWVAETHRTWR